VDEERARAVEDWPEPLPSPTQRAELAAAEQKLLANDARSALATADSLCAALPAWRSARWVRARALEAVGRVDEEARELRILTQLSPSHAEAWRRLGEILAAEGGLLEADRADEALRQALSLEPSWTGLWLVRARVALRQGRVQDALRALDRYSRTGGESAEASRLAAAARAQAGLDSSQGVPAAPSSSREPSPAARLLFQQAASAESPDRARELLHEALADSPGFIEAVVALHASGDPIPEATVQALQADGEGLLELSAQVRRAGGGSALVAPFVDRAVELGAPESRYVRAQLRAEQADRQGALSDLVAYVASAQPRHLAEARALRAQISAPSRTDLSPLLARIRLAEDRPEAALAALGSSCREGMPPERLIALGEVHEFAGEPARALDCYRLAALTPEALRRLARVAEGHPDPRLLPQLQEAEKQGMPEARWALARLDLAAGQRELALPRIERFLATAAPDDVGLAEARAAREAIHKASTAAARARLRDRAALGAGGLLLLVAAASWLWAGSTVESALRRSPRLFPHVARVVNELRHDVLKHRAGVLGMLGGGRREDVARALLSPEPASKAVAAQYEALHGAARAQGISLRRLRREPVFGPLVRDLARAEALLHGQGGEAELLAIDERVRGVHGQRLAALLRLGPRTRLDAAAVAGWIRDVEAEMRRAGSAWTAPSILLQGMEVEFAVERGALSTIFANLLRNAQAASGGGEVIVRLGEERDAAGRTLTVLMVGDSSAHAVSLDAIEQRESGRGLALVRDLTREWQGHLIVRPEEPPWTKAVGARFPAPRS
ncbi:MAG TPA: hypothetical protein VFE90_05190, partial [Myxococcales bacterium]|nr:hypothetical protein [Myxococcales bacterium]